MKLTLRVGSSTTSFRRSEYLRVALSKLPDSVAHIQLFDLTLIVIPQYAKVLVVYHKIKMDNDKKEAKVDGMF